MKKRTLPLLLLIVLFVFTFSKTKAQCILPEPFSGSITGVNMTVMLTPNFVISLPLTTDSSYIVASTQSGMPVGGVCLASDCLDAQGQTSLTIWGDDNFTTELDGAVEGDQITLQLVDGIELYDINPVLMMTNVLAFVSNGISIANNSDVSYNCTFDAEIGCMDEVACNYNPLANSPGECTFADDLCETCDNGQILPNDDDEDGVCNTDEIPGCQDPLACNYNPEATDPPIFLEGTVNNPMECTYIVGDCETCVDELIVDNDADADGVCDADEIVGCMDTDDCNYNALAEFDDGSCVGVPTGCETCDGTIGLLANDDDQDGICNDAEIVGCMDADDCNYNTLAEFDDGSCVGVPTGCQSCDGTTGFLANDDDEDGTCNADEIVGCMTVGDCNYNSDAEFADESCVGVPIGCELCNGTLGILANDDDQDGLCNQFETDGCTNPIACNYNPAATDDDGSCEFSETFYNCEGDCLSDIDGDEVCDQLEVLGCTDDAYMEYDISATQDNGSCLTLIVEGCMDDLYIEYLPEANLDTDPSSCITLIVLGCTDASACNYNSEANTEDSSCEYAEQYYDCAGNCLVDTDADGVCDQLEVYGCTDALACNYDATATEDDASCYFITSSIENFEFEHPYVTVTTDAVDATYAWYLSGLLLEDSLANTLVPSENGAYSVVVTDIQDCSDTLDFTVTEVSLQELNEIPMDIYPNPSSDYINIDFESNLSNVKLELLNAIGDVVLIKTVDEIAANNTIQIAVSEMSDGLYFLKVTADGRLSSLPWIKK